MFTKENGKVRGKYLVSVIFNDTKVISTVCICSSKMLFCSGPQKGHINYLVVKSYWLFQKFNSFLKLLNTLQLFYSKLGWAYFSRLTTTIMPSQDTLITIVYKEHNHKYTWTIRVLLHFFFYSRIVTPLSECVIPPWKKNHEIKQMVWQWM